ncbi:hypothetical protein FV222_03680 [Methylobacterium sp. WL103]|uniref:hypothetical protein n=1 Tax=Methylobacterium sp. WL103 TaxID=2603891 RepID=UPI0011C9BD76|nr:hypothetical protein [Methylobacterium sp. WL103]TXN07011.1 hypothetical protein FV222_03680 [Methylobacterium sp. WL103]
MDTDVAQGYLGKRRDALHATLFREDELGIVIRGHIHVEHELIDFIRMMISPPEILSALDLDYKDKCKLASALGLHKALQAPLKFAGSYRNRFAHNLGVDITQQDADNFHSALLLKGREYFEHSYHMVYPCSTKRNDFWEIKQIEPRNRIVSYFLLLWGGLAVATLEAKTKIEGVKELSPGSIPAGGVVDEGVTQ